VSAFDRLVARACRPIDLAGLAVFRMMFGVAMFVDLARYWLAGWIDSYYLAPAFLFRYPGFDWVHPLPRLGMYALFALLMAAALSVALGFVYRAAAWFLAVGYAYLFLLSATHYLNHAYLLALVAVLMACVPAARGLSIDAWRSGRGLTWAPAWAQGLLRIQIAIVYVYGGIAKINPDWLAGEPLRGWLHGRAESTSWLGDLLQNEAVAGLLVQGGLWFDLLVVPALLWRRTRVLAVLVSLGFHLSNAYLFSIGIFPWFMLMATTLFFDPSWPRRLPWISPRPTTEDITTPARPRLVAGLVSAWLVVQLLVPLRHHLYPGNVEWTEQGHYFAWRMKLRTKSGSARFIVFAPDTGESWVVDPADELLHRQARKMIGKPDLIVQYAHHLAERWRLERGLAVEVRAQVNVSLNHRPRHSLVDPTVDLAAISVSLAPAPWIMPGPTSPVPRPRPR